MENRVNITEELVKRFNVYGYPCEEGSNSYALVCCFISSNLKKLLGTNEPKEEDIELISTKFNLEITTTFYKDPIIFEVNRTKEVVMINVINKNTEEELFRIANYGNLVVNTIYDNENFMEHTYEVDMTGEQSYNYRREEVVDGTRKVVYEGMLQSLGAKYKEKEAFALTTSIPNQPKPKTFVKKLAGVLSGEGCVYIVTSPHSLDTIEFTDRIFDRLEAEADRFTLPTQEIGKKLEKK